MQNLVQKILKQKTLSNKISILMKSILLQSAILLGGIFLILNIISAVLSTNDSLKDKAEITSMNITNTLNDYVSIASSISNEDVFLNFNLSTDQEKKELLNKYAKNNFLYSADFIDDTGKSMLGYTYENMDYIQKCKETLTYSISNVFFNEDKSKMLIAFAYPLIISDKYYGVINITSDASFLTNLLKDIDKDCDEEIYILDKDGNYIAYKFYSYVTDKMNLRDIYKQNKFSFGLKSNTENMISGKTGAGFCNYNGFRYAAYAPIEKTDGWSLSTSVSCADMIKPYLLGVIICCIMIIIVIMRGIKVSEKITDKITTSVVECNKRINLLSQGDLSTPVPILKTNDEIESLCNSLKKTVTIMNEMIFDITNNLEQLEKGNFKLEFNKEYIGDFDPIKQSFSNFINIMGSTLSKINNASQDVAEESDNVAKNSTNLAEDASKQNDKVEEIVTNINRMNLNISEKAKELESRNSTIIEAGKKIEYESKEQVNNLINAMSNIIESSNKIQSIIESIDDIAEQTNLLALNASIEAARAGEAGKGFSVVASEISELANQSINAANSTKRFIGESITTVEDGKKIVDDISRFFTELLKTLNSISSYITEQTEFYLKQEEDIKLVSSSAQKIAEIIENNLSNAKHSAVISEKLSSQAVMLKDEVDVFKY